MRLSLQARLTGVFALALGIFSGSHDYAQRMDKAIQAYNDDKYTEAAFLFYDVIEHSEDADARLKAGYYIAQSLFKAGMFLPAFQYYGEVFNAGDAHPYFLK